MNPRRHALVLAAAVFLVACAGGSRAPAPPHEPPLTHAERTSLQNECVKMADRSERDACLERAALGRR